LVEAVTRQSAPLLPVYLGLPPKFSNFRAQQLDKALDIWTSDKRFQALDASPGTGKSLLYMAVAKLEGEGKRTLILTATKGLQRQVTADFSASGLREIKGQSNYRCVALDVGGVLEGYGAPGSTCAEGPCKVGVRCHLRDGGCTYFDEIKYARESPIVIDNYAHWMALGKYSDPTTLGEFDMLVLDECHEAPDWLTDFASVDLSAAEVKKLLNEELPALDVGVDTWASWARRAAFVASARQRQLRGEMKECGRAHKQQYTKQLLRLSALERDLTQMGQAREWRRTDDATKQVDVPGGVTDWIAYETPKGAKFTPVWAHQYAEQYLFRGIKKIVLSSGTLMPSLLKRLGIDPSKCDWHTVSSSFDPKRRPVYYWPATRVDQKMTEGQRRLWMNVNDVIVGERLDVKGIIHSVSYDRAYEIKRRSKYGDVMLTHGRDNLREVVEEFRRAKPPCVLVSPSVTQGWDFPGDACRYIVIPKVPFASATDPLFKARCQADKNHRFECAALVIIQESLRGMRSAEDWLEVFITDEHFGYMRSKLEWMSWFKAAWKQIDSMPVSLKTRLAA